MLAKFEEDPLEKEDDLSVSKDKVEKDKFKKPKNRPYKRIRGNIDWRDKEDDDDLE